MQDRRDKWHEGIATLVFSEKEATDEAHGGPDPEFHACGEQWRLRLGKGKGKNDQKPKEELNFVFPAGTLYVISREAQGRKEFCKERKVAHQQCECCWRHGVKCCVDAKHTRMSMTMRCYNDNWGREGKKGR